MALRHMYFPLFTLRAAGFSFFHRRVTASSSKFIQCQNKGLSYSNRILDAKDSNLHVGHSRFIAEASRDDKWKDGENNAKKGGDEGSGNEIDGVEKGKG